MESIETVNVSSIETVNESKQTTPTSPPAAADHDDGDDRISGLCDDVLARILASVGGDPAELVRTGVLSRRWRSLWTRVPALHLDSGPQFQSPSDAERFMACVNRVLSTMSGRIEQLGISLNVHYAPGEPRLAAAAVHAAEGWIRYAVQHELTSLAVVVCVIPKKYLLLDKYGHEKEDGDHEMEEEEEEDNYSGDEGDDDDEEDSYSGDEDEEEDGDDDEEDQGDDDKETEPEIALEDLPSWAKLETMSLCLGRARVRLPSSTSVMFRSLTDLALECLEIAADTDSGQLLGRLLSSSSCPRLQKLYLRAVTFNDDSKLHDAMTKAELVIETSTLLKLTMESMHNMSSLELRAPNLRALEIESCDELEVLKVSSASRLKELTFSCSSCLEVGIHGGDLPCVELLGINLLSHVSRYDSDDINDAVISLLESCSSATRLVVDLDVPSEFKRHVDVIEDKIPRLPNVTSLSVNIHPPLFERRHSFGDGVAGLLTRFNNLRYLCIEMDDYFSEDDADGDLPFFCTHEYKDHWIFSDDISLANLITAEFRGLAGTSCELRFLRFMLESAMDLEKVTVRFSVNNNNLEDIDYFLHELLGDDGAWTTSASEDRSYEWRL